MRRGCRKAVTAMGLVWAITLASCSSDPSTPTAGTVTSTVTSTTVTPTTVTPTTVTPTTVASTTADRETERSARLGAAVSARTLEGSDAALVTRHFDSVTAENAMKWSVVRPSATDWDWAEADAIVDFAEREGLDVRGHTLVWGQPAGNGMPTWLVETTDPAAFSDAVLEGIATQVARYRGRVQRWDVVNEPLEPLNGDLQENLFFQRMGPDYIEQALRAARSADPDVELWINETATEYLPEKGDGLVELVRQLTERGVPLDGVGLQTHLFVDVPIPSGSIADLIGRLRTLGVEVALTEVDVPGGSVNRDADAQLAMWGQVVDECVVAGCVELTTWGVTDAHTWLDDPGIRADIPFLQAFAVPSRPLLFDEDGRPKPAFDVVTDALRDGG